MKRVNCHSSAAMTASSDERRQHQPHRHVQAIAEPHHRDVAGPLGDQVGDVADDPDPREQEEQEEGEGDATHGAQVIRRRRPYPLRLHPGASLPPPAGPP